MTATFAEAVMEERRDFIEVLVADHAEAESLLTEIQYLADEPRTAQTVARAKELTDQVINGLVKHSVAEEQHVYPLVRTKLPNGNAVAEAEIAEHAAAEQTMKELDRMTPQNIEYQSTLRRLASQIREHAGKEEADLLPALGGELTQEERLQLGADVEKAKAAAPTRPHPSAPDRPPANKRLGPGVALVDRIRDRLTSRKN